MVRYPAFIPLAAERRGARQGAGRLGRRGGGPRASGGLGPQLPVAPGSAMWGSAGPALSLHRGGRRVPSRRPYPCLGLRPGDAVRATYPRGPKVRRPLPRPPSAPRLEAWPRPPNPAVPGECGKGAEWPWAATHIYREGAKDPGVARPGLVAWEVARRAPSGQRRLGESGQAGALQSQARGPRGSGQGAG